jgi:hypothetical protein
MMREDPLDQLRRENPVTGPVPTVSLVALLRRIENEPAGSSERAAAIGRARPFRESKRRPGRIAGGLWGGVSVAVALAVAAIALIAVGHQRGADGRSARVPPAGQALFSILGVLRRPQTAADRAAALELADQPAAQRRRIERRLAAKERRLAARGVHDVRLERELQRLRGQELPAARPDTAVRLAAVTPWGERVILVPYRSGRTEELCIESGSGDGDCGLTAALIKAGGAWSLEGAGRTFAGGSTAVRLFIIVPDGVAKVAFVLPRDSGVPGGPVYGQSPPVLVPVHNNVAYVQVNRECCAGNLVTRWYGANGRVIKVTGPPTGSRVSGPRPAPETPLSRAAERNPSTANPVHVAPSAGGPSTAFTISWRALLSDADYQITATGPSRAGCRGASDLSGIVGGGINDVRGRLYGVTIPSDGRPGRGSGGWCPGTYHVSVTLYDLGLAGGLRHADRPFGRATFTVTP